MKQEILITDVQDLCEAITSTFQHLAEATLHYEEL